MLKLLIPNYAAGALIGKAGANISEIQSKFGGSMRLSPNKEFYPGTDERIVVLTGEINQLVDLNNHIMEKVQTDQSQRTENRPKDEVRSQQIKIVLTNGAAGSLIGRGGATIKAIQEETKTKINITNRDEANVPGERVLTMSGSMEQRMLGCQQVIEKVAGEASNMTNSTLKYANTAMSISASIGGGLSSLFTTRQPESTFTSLSSIGSYGVASQQNTISKLKTNVQIQMEIPDILVGAILGKHGQTITEFIQFSGAKIQFSGKNEFAPGTTDRILTITGDMKQTQTAYFLVSQKAEQAQAELNR